MAIIWNNAYDVVFLNYTVPENSVIIITTIKMKTGSGTLVKADFLLSHRAGWHEEPDWGKVPDAMGRKALHQEGSPPSFLLNDLLQDVAPHRALLSGVSIRKGLKRQIQLMTNCSNWQKNFDHTPNNDLRDNLVHGRVGRSSLRKTHKNLFSLEGLSLIQGYFESTPWLGVCWDLAAEIVFRTPSVSCVWI